jgi:hypothetical protein
MNRIHAIKRGTGEGIGIIIGGTIGSTIGERGEMFGRAIGETRGTIGARGTKEIEEMIEEGEIETIEIGEMTAETRGMIEIELMIEKGETETTNKEELTEMTKGMTKEMIEGMIEEIKGKKEATKREETSAKKTKFEILK